MKKNSLFLLLIIIVTFLLIYSCKKEEVDNNQPPSVPVYYSPKDSSDLIFNQSLIWYRSSDPENDQVTYDIYIGKTETPERYVSNHSDTILNYNYFDNFTEYFWKIVAKDNHNNIAEGSIYRFTTDSIIYNCIDIELNNYDAVRIGNQVWMAENLRTTRYNNGDEIEQGFGNIDYSNEDQLKYYYNFNDDVENTYTYGRLYSWYAIDDERKICPTGWHIPSENEWSRLINYLGGDSVAGGKLKAKGIDFWDFPNRGATNEYGFTALPGGSRGYYGKYYSLGKLAFFWSSTVNMVNGNGEFCYYYLENNSTIITKHSDNHNNMGFSVRCVKN